MKSSKPLPIVKTINPPPVPSAPIVIPAPKVDVKVDVPTPEVNVTVEQPSFDLSKILPPQVNINNEHKPRTVHITIERDGRGLISGLMCKEVMEE